MYKSKTILLLAAALFVAGLSRDGQCAAAADDDRDTEASTTKIAGLIRQLGDVDFDLRERAQQQLIALGSVALPQLQAAAESKDAEIAFRARSALRQITSLAPERKKRLRAAGQAAFHAGDHAVMLRSYQQLTQGYDALVDDHRWLGHAQQLLGNWQQAAKAYVAALDRIDLILKGEIDQNRSPDDFKDISRREDFVRQRLGLIIAASRIQRELADDPKTAESVLKRVYEYDDLLNESLVELDAKWQSHIVEAIRADKSVVEFRREGRRNAELYIPMLVLRELALTQQRLKKPKEALATWHRIHLLSHVYLGHSDSVDANAVGMLVQMLAEDDQAERPGCITITKDQPTRELKLSDAETIKNAYSIYQNYWTFALTPPIGQEFASLKFSCDIEQIELRYGGQFDCWTEIGDRDPRRKSIGSIGWPHDQQPGRSVQTKEFDIEPGSGVVHFQSGSWAGKFTTHGVTVTATFRDRVEDPEKRPQPTPGFRIQNECLPKDGKLTHNGKPYRSEVASHDVLPGKHVYTYSHPQHKLSQTQSIDAEPGRYYGLFINLDSPFASRCTNLGGVKSHYGANSSFVKMPNGRWLAAWANDSLHFASSDDLIHWSEPWQSAEAALYGVHFDAVLPSLYVDKEGTIWLAYFSNRLDVDRINTGGYRLFVAKSTDGRKWSPPRAIELEMSGWPPGVVQMFDGPGDKVWMMYRLRYAVADRMDDITTLGDLKIPTTEKVRSHARNPYAVFDKTGRMHVVWDHFGQSLYYARRELDGKWTRPVEIWDRKLGSRASHPLLFMEGNRLALIYSEQSAYLQRGRFVEGTPVFGEPIKITHHVSPLISTQPRKLDDGRRAILCGKDTIWLRTVTPQQLFGQ